MALNWNNKNTILRDLSVAQGREVPVEIENPVAFDEKPPALKYTEETEEEFFSGCTGGGDLIAGPDYSLIQQMLNMVREANGNSIESCEDGNDNTLIEISKSDPQLNTNSINSEKTQISQKKKVKRNIAIESLIQTYGNNMNNNNDGNQKLLKPDDFMHKENNETHVPEKLKMPILTSPIGMFKKKVSNKNANVQKPLSPSITNNVTHQQNCGYFIPSSFAGERYKTYLEKSKLQEQVKEDIWARAEREMKERDAKRNKEMTEYTTVSTTSTKSTTPTATLTPTSSSSTNTPSSEISSNFEDKSPQERGMDYVRLPQHRHLLTGDCKVCEVLCVHNNED